jgi:hypothetical protein
VVYLGLWWWVLPAVLFGVAFKITGHGQYFDLGTYSKQSDRRQFVDPVVDFFFGPDPNWTKDGVEGNKWRDFFGLTITGIGVSIGVGLALIFTGHSIAALAIISAAALKGVAYVIGYAVRPNNHPTEIGEYLTGFFGGAGLAGALLLV